MPEREGKRKKSFPKRSSLKKGSGKKGGKRQGEPSGEDLRLWKDYTKEIMPIHKPPHDDSDPVRDSSASQQKPPAFKPPPVLSQTRTIPQEPPQLDLRTATRLRKGQIPIDGRLDLHGHTQAQAQTMLHDFIGESFRSGKRCLLIITGKGRGGKSAQDAYAPNLEPGILKQKLPEWLSAPSMRPLILKITPAAAKHGGGGAFYVYLKRQR